MIEFPYDDASNLLNHLKIWLDGPENVSRLSDV